MSSRPSLPTPLLLSPHLPPFYLSSSLFLHSTYIPNSSQLSPMVNVNSIVYRQDQPSFSIFILNLSYSLRYPLISLDLGASTLE